MKIKKKYGIIDQLHGFKNSFAITDSTTFNRDGFFGKSKLLFVEEIKIFHKKRHP
jgi:hypothetical protein